MSGVDMKGIFQKFWKAWPSVLGKARAYVKRVLAARRDGRIVLARLAFHNPKKRGRNRKERNAVMRGKRQCLKKFAGVDAQTRLEASGTVLTNLTTQAAYSRLREVQKDHRTTSLYGVKTGLAPPVAVEQRPARVSGGSAFLSSARSKSSRR